MGKQKKTARKDPIYKTMTEFLRGQASKIFEEVTEGDETVIVNKNSKPHTVVISYERYKKLRDEGADI